ncbi:hypothetical protein FRB91_010555 [Serendipita sp. 411]|nr:hypothetical protein FRB91_010555 [Serendipita sp. 411]
MAKGRRKQPPVQKIKEEINEKPSMTAISTKVAPRKQEASKAVDQTQPTRPQGTASTEEENKTEPVEKKKAPSPRIVVPPRPVIQRWKDGNAPPEFVINLDEPPKKRWKEAVEWGAYSLQSTVYRYRKQDEGNFVWKKTVLFGLMQAIEKRYLFSNEQYAEMKGIAEQADIPFEDILAYNLVLTHQFGCTSGTVPFIGDGRLLHYRNLDTNLSLPQLLIQAHFKRGGETVAKAITHLGHVVLTTGVRQGLSISINTDLLYGAAFAQSFQNKIDWLLHDPFSITIRDLLLREETPTLEQAVDELTQGHPFGIFTLMSDGISGKSIGHSVEDIVVDEDKGGILTLGNHFSGDIGSAILLANSSITRKLEDSMKRVSYMERMVHRGLERVEGQGVPLENLRSWISKSPIKTPETALSCIMDPTAGEISWCAAYQT